MADIPFMYKDFEFRDSYVEEFAVLSLTNGAFQVGFNNGSIYVFEKGKATRTQDPKPVRPSRTCVYFTPVADRSDSEASSLHAFTSILKSNHMCSHPANIAQDRIVCSYASRQGACPLFQAEPEQTVVATEQIRLVSRRSGLGKHVYEILEGEEVLIIEPSEKRARSEFDKLTGDNEKIDVPPKETKKSFLASLVE